jgi:hypothetical protein
VGKTLFPSRVRALEPYEGFFTKPNNTWAGLLSIATGFFFFLAAGVLAAPTTSASI